MKEPKRIELSEPETAGLLKRLSEGALREEDVEALGAIVESWMWLTRAVREKTVSIKELQKLIFGAQSEKTETVLKQKARGWKNRERTGKEKPKGHGRNGAEVYTEAERVFTQCEGLAAGDRCPKCDKGKLRSCTPSRIVCVKGQAPLPATVYEQECLRCNLCGAWFKARLPPEAQGPKYDPSAGSMIALLRYGGGFPHHRLEGLQANLGVPLPSSTQWDIVNEMSRDLRPVFDEMNHQAAGAELFHNDDTSGRILDLEKEIAEEADAARRAGKKTRTGVFTSGILAKIGGRKIALFFTGRKHAGENLSAVVARRPEGLSPPIHMCDALSRNAPKAFRRLLAHCLCHGRRNFVKLIEDFPEHVRHVLETLRDVYRNEALAARRKMSDAERLAFHQKHSESIMDTFFDWLNAQIDGKIVEPNSGMGKAILYMIDHWEALTLFLSVPGAPLDNNICERALKVVIRHRNNSLFYKTEHGAEVGDLFMSLIHTCRLNGVNAFKYLTAIQQHAGHIAAAPADWMPWNYQETMAALCPDTP